jgi:hypothetical protein
METLLLVTELFPSQYPPEILLPVMVPLLIITSFLLTVLPAANARPP